MFFMLPSLDPVYNDWTTGDEMTWWDAERSWEVTDQWSYFDMAVGREGHPIEISYSWCVE